MTNHVESPYTRPVQIGSATVGGGHPFVVIAGPALEPVGPRAADMISLAERMSAKAREVDVPLIFRVAVKDRVDGASTVFGEMLATLREVRARVNVPVAIDLTEPQQVSAAAEVADLLQIPGARCRQTDLVLEAARTGRPVNVEKDPSLTPWDAVNLVETVVGVGNWNVMLTECGTTVGHDHLVVEFDGFSFLRETGFPLVFDAGGGEMAANGLAAGADGISLVVQDDSLASLPGLLQRLKGIAQTV